MNRQEFIQTLGLTTVAVCAGCSLNGCSSDSADPSPSASGTTIDLSEPANAALTTVGGAMIKNSIIIARTGATTFVAVAKACTHQGTTIEYEHGNSRFHCPNHSSNFNLDGTVMNGPANTALKKYTATLNGNILTIS